MIAGFKAIPPAPPATTSGTPAWLAGWWKVADGGDTYFYHFDRNGDVVWVEAKPPKGGTPLGNIGNRGRFKLTGDDALQITWNWVAGGQTIEDFTATDVPKTHMNGTSNRWGATCRGSDQLEHAALRRDSLRDTGKLVAARILRGRLRDDTKYAALLAK